MKDITIEVYVDTIEEAKEVIEEFGEKSISLVIYINKKENTTTKNSDAFLKNFDFDKDGAIVGSPKVEG